MRPAETIARFDRYLASVGVRFEATIIGGAALGLLGVTARQTQDVDVLRPPLPLAVRRAAKEFARRERARGRALPDDWFNDVAVPVGEVLPAGWEARTEVVFEGSALRLRVPSRRDLLKTKLFALCDRGMDLADCVALAPTPRELAEARAWLVRQDAHPGWPAHVDRVLGDLARRLGHGV